MVFSIQLLYARTLYVMTVELVKKSGDFELFKIYNPKTPENFILIRGNRPMLQAKGLKRKPTSWRLVEGRVKNTSTYHKVLGLINAQLNPPPVSKKGNFWIANPELKRPPRHGGPGKYRGRPE